MVHSVHFDGLPNLSMGQKCTASGKSVFTTQGQCSGTLSPATSARVFDVGEDTGTAKDVGFQRPGRSK